MISKRNKLNLIIFGSFTGFVFVICCIGVAFSSSTKTSPTPVKTNVVILVSTSMASKPSAIHEMAMPSFSATSKPATVPKVTIVPKATKAASPTPKRTHSGTVGRGQYCPANEHYWYGITTSGVVLQCVFNNGWRWE